MTGIKETAVPAPTSHDFDTVIDRRDSDSLKWRRYAGRDILPMWVADMDFAAPPPVIAAIGQRLQQGVLGYGEATPEVTEAIRNALLRDFAWAVEPEWIITLPGLVSALNIAARATAAAGEAILTATPVYRPLFSAPHQQEREALTVPLLETAAGWAWDWPAMEAAIPPRTRALFLCHPHNPVGRVWRENDLQALAGFAERHDLIVVSDEVHGELILEPGLRHQPFATISPDMARRTITLMAPSKTYNIPGLGVSFAIISDAALRARFNHAMAGIVPHVNILGLAAMTAAYRDSADWRSALLDYLRGNRDRVLTALDGYEGLKVTRPEATYLAWIDCRAAGIAQPRAFFEAAGVGLSDGSEFGLPGFVRLNFGCPRATLDEALRRMREAMKKRV